MSDTDPRRWFCSGVPRDAALMFRRTVTGLLTLILAMCVAAPALDATEGEDGKPADTDATEPAETEKDPQEEKAKKEKKIEVKPEPKEEVKEVVEEVKEEPKEEKVIVEEPKPTQPKYKSNKSYKNKK